VEPDSAVSHDDDGAAQHEPSDAPADAGAATEGATNSCTVNADCIDSPAAVAAKGLRRARAVLPSRRMPRPPTRASTTGRR
jgi:hypothetical protein